MSTDPAESKLPDLRIVRNLYSVLESDALVCFQYAEPSPENRGTFSVRLLDLHSRACAAIDSTLHMWYDELRIGTKDRPSLPDYYPIRKVLGLRFEVALELQHRPDMLVAPFRDWDGSADKLPQWWTAHNQAKHRLNDETFRLANLVNAISALGALYLVLNDRETRSTHPVGSRVFRPLY